MSKYTITIEGDFEKGECEKCPLLAVNNYYPDVVYCPINFGEVPCPLEEVKQGEWMEREFCTSEEPDYATCSHCNERVVIGFDDNFCPNCGADMRGGKK